MPTSQTDLQTERAELIQSADDARDPADLFKLLAAMRSLVDVRLADLKAKDSATLLNEGDRATASANVRSALDQLNELLRDGYNFIKAIPSYEISDADRLGLFTNYGWVSGKVGEIDDARAESLANQAITVTPTIANPARRYPDQLVALITDELATVNANQPIATGGGRQSAIAARDEALRLLETINDRVRFYYCSASDDEDRTPELAKIGRQPRRAKGTAGGSSGGDDLPGEPGEATLDSTALTLSVPELPEGATGIRAHRQPAGGVAEVAGNSETNTVSLEENGPLTPDTTYEFWVVGTNEFGEGPESNHVQHTTPAAVV